MNHKTLVERLRMTGKEIQGPCPDGIDGCLVLHPMINTDPLCKEAADTIEAQATRIEALEAALRRIKDATANEMRAGDKGYVSRYGIHGIATKALEGSGNG